MINLERRVAWLFRAALRRCFDSHPGHADQARLQIRLSSDGLLMHAAAPEITLFYRQPAPTGNLVLSFPVAHLAELEGRTDDMVTIAPLRDNIAGARWKERGQQREIQIPLLEPEKNAEPPEPPMRFASLPGHFLLAYHQASESAAPEPTKYIINRVQLHGKIGAVIGTDTRQLLVSGGYSLPFKDNLMVPQTSAFGLAPFSGLETVRIGKTSSHVWIQAGPWQFALLIEKKGRYPDAMSIVPRPSRTDTRFKLDADDAQRFLDSLVGRIKGAAAKEIPLTLDLRDQPCLRFAVDKAVTEVKLPKSQVTGQPLCLCLNLQQFLRALEMRFQEFTIRSAEKPVAVRDGERIFLLMPVSSDQAIPPQVSASPARSEEALAPHPAAPMPVAAAALAERPATPIDVATQPPAVPAGGFDVFVEAEGLRDGLVKVAAHAGRILQFLREVCGQQRLTTLLRNSLLTLDNRSGGNT